MQLRLPAQRDLRVRKLPQSGLSDREVFDALPLDDPWLDAGLPTVYAYLYCCSSVRPRLTAHFFRVLLALQDPE